MDVQHSRYRRLKQGQRTISINRAFAGFLSLVIPTMVFSILFVVFAAGSLCVAAENGIDAASCRNLGYVEKVDCCVSILKRHPCNRDAFLLLTWTMGEKNQWKELMEKLAYLSEFAPDAPHFYQMRALILTERIGAPEAASAELKKTEGLKRCMPTEEEELLKPLPPTQENAERILQRGFLRYSRLADYAGAARDFETYLGLVPSPKNPSVFGSLAGARRQMGDLPGAIDALTLEIEAFPERAQSVLLTRARLYQELGDHAAAEKDLADSVRLTEERDLREIARVSGEIDNNPKDAWAYIERGRIKLKIGDYVGAIDDASEAIALESTFCDAYELRAKAKAGLGNLDGAKDDRVQAVRCRKEKR